MEQNITETSKDLTGNWQVYYRVIRFIMINYLKFAWVSNAKQN
jgi:hypothetical protein